MIRYFEKLLRVEQWTRSQWLHARELTLLFQEAEENDKPISRALRARYETTLARLDAPLDTITYKETP